MTHPRLPLLTPADLDAAQAELRASIAGGDRARDAAAFALIDENGALTGPFNAMLHAPAVGDALQRLGTSIRYGTSLTGRARELAILLVATAWDSAFERLAHEAVGQRVGLTEAELASLRIPRKPASLDEVEALVYDVTSALLAGDVDDELWQRGVQSLGHQMLVELSTLVGYYATLALQLRVFRVVAE
ncbi:carboxymuconolactone decarboxylase family protein [Nocardioides sp.]|uniref:carboxymuconolactone decarboxylase family protein n=1 Tax=Nocardioides sp. TaxID=35761 RepID=UPI0039E368EF